MSDPELYQRMALRRVEGGGMAKAAGAYVDHGRPTPGHLIEVFDQLIRAGLVVIAEGDVIWELRRMSLTDTGKARYAVLAERLDPQHTIPLPELGPTTQTPVDRRSSTLPRLPAIDRVPPHERR